MLLRMWLYIYSSERHLPHTSTFSKNRITHVLLFRFHIWTPKFCTRRRSFHSQSHEGRFSINVFVSSVDVSTRCGPLSNVDFIYFVWQNFERISSKHYAITLIPSGIASLSTPPRLICLKYYRAASDWWKDAVNCDTCVEEYQTTMRTHCGCRVPEICFCTICLRQPLHRLVQRYTYITNW